MRKDLPLPAWQCFQVPPPVPPTFNDLHRLIGYQPCPLVWHPIGSHNEMSIDILSAVSAYGLLTVATDLVAISGQRQG